MNHATKSKIMPNNAKWRRPDKLKTQNYAKKCKMTEWANMLCHSDDPPPPVVEGQSIWLTLSFCIYFPFFGFLLRDSFLWYRWFIQLYLYILYFYWWFHMRGKIVHNLLWFIWHRRLKHRTLFILFYIIHSMETIIEIYKYFS